jgi:L-asparaginase
MDNILIIYTGGTIGMMHDKKSGVLKPFNFGKLTSILPELKKISCRIDFHSFQPLIDSSDMNPDLWIKLATLIEKNYSRYDGFIILHGTDTMVYSASALSYMLGNLNKPVLLTGSQLPISEIRTDAKTNLITAVEIVAGNFVVPEVCIFFNNQLFRGNRAEKYTSSKFDAFQSINYPVLAESGTEIVFYPEFIKTKSSETKLVVQKKFCKDVFVIKLFPGINAQIISHIAREKKLKGIILETYGSGNAPTSQQFLDAIKYAVKKKIVIVNVSQCSGGVVEMERYENGLLLKKAGVISAHDMTTEAAITKLMFLLGGKSTVEEIHLLMQQPLAGELSRV